jgi:hypothetical protein
VLITVNGEGESGMGFDENRSESEWVNDFVSKGGERSAGEALFQKMQQARTENKGGATPTTHLPVTASTPPSTVDSSPDLFGTPPQVTVPASSTKPPRPQAPARRGRKPAEFNREPQSQRELELFELSMEIEERNAKETGDTGFLATAMIYASLPHSEFKEAVFKRTNGFTTLTILNDPDIGLPYGKIPRIITAFLCTEAKRHKDTRGREIHLGKSQAEFLSKLGLSSTGGERGDIGRVRDQAKRLFTSSITLTGTPGHEFHWQRVNISQSGMLLWDRHDPHKNSRWQSKLMLSPEFYDECIQHSVPISLSVLHKLRSPLAIDIYIWLTYRYNSIVAPTPVTWKQLQWQFGSNYANTPRGESDFKTNFKKQLRAVLNVYRDAKIDVGQDRVLLLPSKPHIDSNKLDYR